MKIKTILLLCTILSACSSSKTYKLRLQGEFAKTNFTEEMNFRYVNKLILIDVQIENKTYTCVFDSGAEISLFDQKVINEISYKEVANKNVSGSSGNKSKYTFLKIPKIKIASLEFLSLGAISSDLSAINSRFMCKEPIHGIIGNNLMRKALWRIDYQKQKIWIADQLSSLDDLQDDIVVNLDCSEIGNVYIPSSLDGVEQKFTFDTGKNTKMKSNSKTFQKLLENNEDLQYSPLQGITGITLNGPQYGTTNYTLINKLEFGEIVLNNQIIEMEENENASSLMGNEIWENYRVTIDWNNCNLYLNPQKTIEHDSLFKFQYNFSTNDSSDGLKLTNKWLQHSSSLNLNEKNEVLSIEGINVSNLEIQDYCNFLDNELQRFKMQDTVSIMLLNNDLKEQVLLTKEQLLPK